ncbi:MAG: lycopene cyclase family protein [Cyclobacteriaceae bacterium]
MTYDIIIAGAGLGGLSFAHFLIKNRYNSKRVLIIDAAEKNSNDRTWSFWSCDTPTFKCANKRAWSQLGFATEAFVKYESIDPYKYYTIHGIDFYEEVLDEINKSSFITFKQEKITSILDNESCVEVNTTESKYTADYVIDSITRPKIDENEFFLNWQNFVGWKIRTRESTFDVNKPLLMDFRVPQTDSANFIYILPYHENEALVEYTQFSWSRNIDKSSCEKELQTYIREILGASNFDILEEEIGSIPMTNYPFDPSPSDRVFRIGIVGGDTKPTTGYTFQNVQKHCSLIYSQINGASEVPETNPRFAFYDNLLLGIIENHPEQLKAIMSKLFGSQPMSRVLKFLDEETNLIEELSIFSQLPWAPFLSELLIKKPNVNAG